MTTHLEVDLAIQYWGTPVVLITTLNEDSSVNVAPMSSAWWLGASCMLGFDASSQTVANLQRERECVLNLASRETADAVNRLALTTGAPSVPVHKRLLGYRAVSGKLERAGLTVTPSTAVRTPRLSECQVQLEAVVEHVRPFARADPKMAVPACSVEVRIVRTHVDRTLLRAPDRVDATKWKPLLMSFRELFVMGEQVGASQLAQGEESLYAPWKRGLLMTAGAKVLGAFAHARYGVTDEPEGE